MTEMHERYDVIVLGAGCGSVIGRRLAREGRSVLIVDLAGTPSSTARNHRIKHSGAMQREVASARGLWAAFERMDALERAHLRPRGATFLVGRDDLDGVLARWSEAGIPFRLAPQRLAGPLPAAARGAPAVAVATPDRLIDYPAVVEDALGEAVAAGARVEANALRTRLVPDGDRIDVLVEGADGSRLVRSRHCVVAAGGWTPELLGPVGVSVPVVRSKTHILTLPGELVPRLTVRLGPPLLVMVPFRGTTLVGDERRVPATDGDDVSVDPDLAEALRGDAGSAFARVDRRTVRVARVGAAVKTEVAGMGSRAQGMAVFDEDALGVRGLTVVVPGKASLMFALAERTAACIADRGRVPWLGRGGPCVRGSYRRGGEVAQGVSNEGAIVVPGALRDALVTTIRTRLPRKSFGYLVSDTGPRTPTDFVLFDENVRNDPRWRPPFEAYGRYFVDHPDAGFVATPEESWRRQKEIWARGMYEVGVFHSHRRHPGNLSQIDFDMHVARSPELWHLIVSMRNPQLAQIRAFVASEGAVRELPVVTGRASPERSTRRELAPTKDAIVAHAREVLRLDGGGRPCCRDASAILSAIGDVRRWGDRALVQDLVLDGF